MTGKTKYVLAVDHGTSGVKTALISVYGQVVAYAGEATDLLYLPRGGVEQCPEQWWTALKNTIRHLMAPKPVEPEAIAAICVSSTFSSTVAVDQNGEALMNAVTWMDRRGGPYIKKIMAGQPSFAGYGLGKALRWIRKTGGAPTLSGKDDIGHILFIKNERPEIYARTHKFLPSKDFFNFKLTGRCLSTVDAVHLFWLTDIRDVDRIDYDEALITAFGLDKTKLPALTIPTAIIGPISEAVAAETGLAAGTPVIAGSPDHQTACVGSGAVRDYAGHLYLGTSSWVQCPVPFKKTDVLHSIASFPSAMPGKYQAVNEQDMAGGCLSFLLNHLLGKAGLQGAEFSESAAAYQALNHTAAQSAPGSGGLIFTPWLNGERTPVDDETIRGCLFNLATTTGQPEICRSFLEGVAYNTRWSLTYVEKFSKRKLDPLHIIGGGAQSDLWCQIMADVLNREIRRVKDPLQANARGAAFIAAVALGKIRFADIPDLIEYDAYFLPQAGNRAIYDRLYPQFRRLYSVHKKICRAINQDR